MQSSRIRRVGCAWTFLLALLVSTTASAQAATPRSYVYVQTTGATGAMAVIDTTSNKVVGAVAPTYNAEAVAASQDGRFVYVGSSSGVVRVIGTATNTTVATIPVAGEDGAAFSPDGGLLYFTREAASSVEVLSTATDTVVKQIPLVGSYPRGIAVTPDGQHLYVADHGGGVAVVDPATAEVKYVEWKGHPADDVAITPDGKLAYVTSAAGSEDVGVIEIATDTIVAELHTGAGINQGDRALAMTPDGAYVYVTNEADNTVSVISTTTLAVVKTIPVGIAPGRVAITPDGKSAYVANYGTSAEPIGTLSVIDTATNAVIATIPVESPNHLAITPAITVGWLPAEGGAPAPTPRPILPPPHTRPRAISPGRAFSLPAASKCVSHRRFTIHVRKLAGVTWTGAVVRINHKRFRTIKRRRISAVVTLVGLPKGTFVLSITATALDGRKVTGTRTYHTCVPRRKRHYPAPRL